MWYVSLFVLLSYVLWNRDPFFVLQYCFVVCSFVFLCGSLLGRFCFPPALVVVRSYFCVLRYEFFVFHDSFLFLLYYDFCSIQSFFFVINMSSLFVLLSDCFFIGHSWFVIRSRFFFIRAYFPSLVSSLFILLSSSFFLRPALLFIMSFFNVFVLLPDFFIMRSDALFSIPSFFLNRSSFFFVRDDVFVVSLVMFSLLFRRSSCFFMSASWSVLLSPFYRLKSYFVFMVDSFSFSNVLCLIYCVVLFSLLFIR